MNTILYAVIKTVGLPTGQLGPGMPEALFEGSLVKGHRIEEFLPRLTAMEAIQIAPDQSAEESILKTPKGEPIAVAEPEKPTTPAAPIDPLGHLNKPGLLAIFAQMGKEPPKDAKKQDLLDILRQYAEDDDEDEAEAKPVTPTTGPATGAATAEGTGKLGDPLDLSDVQGMTNRGAN